MKKTFLFFLVLFFVFISTTEAQFYYRTLKAKKITSEAIIVTGSLTVPKAHIVSLSVDTLIINTDTILNVSVFTVQQSNTGEATDTMLTVISSLTAPNATITYLNSTKDTITILITTLAKSSVSTVADSIQIGSEWFDEADLRPFSVYSVLLTTADGTLPPDATVLLNTFGSIVWTKTDTGTYVGTTTGEFTVTKTFVPQVLYVNNTDYITAVRTSDTEITITHGTFDGARVDGLSGIPFEIRKYLY